MLIVTKVFLASGVAALAMAGPADVETAQPVSQEVQAAAASSQEQLARQMQAMPPCQAGCNVWQALALRH